MSAGACPPEGGGWHDGFLFEVNPLSVTPAKAGGPFGFFLMISLSCVRYIVISALTGMTIVESARGQESLHWAGCIISSLLKLAGNFSVARIVDKKRTDRVRRGRLAERFFFSKKDRVLLA